MAPFRRSWQFLPLLWAVPVLIRGVSADVAANVRSTGSFREAFRRGLAALLRATPFDRSALGGLGGFSVDVEAVLTAVAALESAVTRRQDSVDAIVALAIASGIFADYQERAEDLLVLALKLKPGHYVALLTLGLLRADIYLLTVAVQLNPKGVEAWLAFGSAKTHKVVTSPVADASAQDAAQDAEHAFRQAVSLRPDSRHVLALAGQGLRRIGLGSLADDVFQAAAARGIWHHPLQRPRAVFWPGLRSAPLPGSSLEAEWPWCRRVRLQLQLLIPQLRLQEEFENARTNKPPQEYHEGAHSYWVQQCASPGANCAIRGLNLLDHPGRAEGQWAEYTIWDPLRHASEECAWDQFPNACSVVTSLREQKVPTTRLSITEVYPPRTYIPRHHSPQQGRLRLLCPLAVPANSYSRLVFPGAAEMAYSSEQQGECQWFDESFEHELHYEGEGPRASLVLDLPHPALLDLSPERRIEPLLEAPSLPEHWNFLYGPVLAMARHLGLCTASVANGSAPLWPAANASCTSIYGL
eukprot:gnl/TRDRNA2_/TRDRNA2_31181_c0_seq1.p1 gnl/TRDRNA2_/TRDRNA2_31181_c0~~gnl/TRDRNA2_/TRDRNA2_31181_c0_seq1.p1  ORF type:complete len:526 (-),score=74.41 gnl/TRDRNA2_/TRDRNA2_31181_c0_seq1:3-1580(-)